MIFMSTKKFNIPPVPDAESSNQIPKEVTESPGKLSETWAQDTIQELDDWIESQGVYIRQ